MESIVIQSELMEIRADSSAKAEGVVIESFVRHGLGSVSNAVVQEGMLKKGTVSCSAAIRCGTILSFA